MVDSRAYDKTINLAERAAKTILRVALRFTEKEIRIFLAKKQEYDRAIKVADNPEKAADEIMKKSYGEVLDGGDGRGGKVGIAELKAEGLISDEQFNKIDKNMKQLCFPDENIRDVSLDEKAVRAASASTFSQCVIQEKYNEYQKTGDISVFDDIVEKSEKYMEMPSYVMSQKDHTKANPLTLDEKLAKAKSSAEFANNVKGAVDDIGKLNNQNILNAAKNVR